MMDNRVRDRLLRIALVMLIVVVLLWHPVSRQIVVLLLPLGSGFDDLLGLVGLIVGGLCLFGWIWMGIPTWFFRRR